jgi:hypothetical protein
MKKILFIGPYTSGTGYDNSLLEYIYSADEVGLDVVCRRVKMTNSPCKVSDKILELENKDVKNIDAIFQYNLPSEFQYKSGILNIGGFAYETVNSPKNFWKYHIALLDKVVHPCRLQMKNTMSYDKNQLDNRHLIIPYSLDKNKFQKTYSKFDLGDYNSAYKFYTISEFNIRKNIPELMLSYFKAFSSNDNVVLVIKTHIPNASPEVCSSEVKNIIKDLQERSGIYQSKDRYPKIALITEFLSEEQLCSLHQTCNTFVSMSRGEGWCHPAIDSIAFGNNIIAPNFGAFSDYHNYSSNFGILIDGSYSPCLGNKNAPFGLYSSNELWFRPSVEAMTYEMMNVIDIKESTQTKEARSKEILNNLCRTNIGNQIKELVENNAK